MGAKLAVDVVGKSILYYSSQHVKTFPSKEEQHEPDENCTKKLKGLN